MPPPLWAMSCCPILLEPSGFHLSHQRSLFCRNTCWLLSFPQAHLRRVWLCIPCLPLRQWKKHLLPHRPSLWAEEAQLPPLFLTCHVLHTLTKSVAAAELQLVTISLTPGTQMGRRAPCTAPAAPDSEECSPDDGSLKLWNDLEKAIKAGVRYNAFDVSQLHHLIISQ